MPRTSSKLKKVSKKKVVKPRKKSVRASAPKKRTSARSRLLLRAVRRRAREPERSIIHLARHEKNPIIEPRETNFWEMKATFNPGAIYADHRVHLLYRAIGGDDISVLGYASSDDGVTIVERLDEPAFVPTQKDRVAEEKNTPPLSAAYFSGGGWNGGCEDPRLTMVDDRIYLMYTAFDGWGSIRIALSSIEVNDFLAKQWHWKKPSLISPPGEIHKNWVLFPEKIHGKFAILHSISPEIRIDYFDDLSELDSESTFVQSSYNRAPRKGVWDSWIRGAGPPPIRTKIGWLLFYHAMDVRDPNRYKLGAMILDLDDPTKVLYRSRAPILEPDLDYENNGFKSGVVYSCGAIVKGDELYVYYGGADSVTCVAIAKLETFLDQLKTHGTPRLAPQAKGSAKRSS